MSSRKQKPRVSVREETKKRLYLRKNGNDSWDDVVTRLLDATDGPEMLEATERND